MNSKIDHERGIVTVSVACYSTMPVGYKLPVCGFGYVRSPIAQDLEDLRARLVLLQNGHAFGEGVRVKPPDGALLEAVQNGTVNPLTSSGAT